MSEVNLKAWDQSPIAGLFLGRTVPESKANTNSESPN